MSKLLRLMLSSNQLIDKIVWLNQLFFSMILLLREWTCKLVFASKILLHNAN